MHCVTSKDLSTLPMAVTGSDVRVTTRSGSLNPAQPAAVRKARTSATVGPLPFGTTTAQTLSPTAASGTLITATRATAGWVSSRFELVGRDVLAVSGDHVLDATGDDEMAGLELAHLIPTAIEPIRGDGSRIMFCRRIIAIDGVGAPRQQFTDFPGDTSLVRIDDAHLVQMGDNGLPCVPITTSGLSSARV